MKTIQFVGSVTIQRELFIDAPLDKVARLLRKDVEEVEAMSQEELEELLMDNIYEIDYLAFQSRTSGFDCHDDYTEETFQDLIVSDTEEVVE
jgi:hypothetical protein